MYSIIGTPKLIVGHDFLSLLGTLMIFLFYFCRYVVTIYIHQFTLFCLLIIPSVCGHCNGRFIGFLSNPIAHFHGPSSTRENSLIVLFVKML